MVSQCPATAFDQQRFNLTTPYIFGVGCTPAAHGDHAFGGFEDALFAETVQSLLRTHVVTTPLFLFWAMHAIHTPLQIPVSFFEKFSFMAPSDKVTHERQIYHALVAFADAALGNATELLKQRGMWNDTLVILSSDNVGI